VDGVRNVLGVLKIGEFSQSGRVSVQMLRHYDATGLLKPRFYTDASKYEKTFGPFSATPHEEAITRTVAWFRKREGL